MTQRVLELLLLYVVAPLILAMIVRRGSYRGAMAPILWVISVLACVLLNRDPSFDHELYSRFPLESRLLVPMALRFLLLAGTLLVLGRRLAPDDFLRLPRSFPLRWSLLVVLYPILSVVPQGIVWRVFFVQRYGSIVGAGGAGGNVGLIIAGALAFSFGHIIYRNLPALVITAIGGALFMQTYLASQSMLLAAAEHGAYGIVAFTAGLGRFLYMGRRWRTPSPGT